MGIALALIHVATGISSFSISSNNSNSGSIRLPFRYVQSFIILDVEIDNMPPVKLIFDTGAEHTILFEKRWTDQLKNPYQREIKVVGSDLLQELPALLTSPLSLLFGNKLQFLSPLIVLQENTTSISQVVGETIHGILSAAIFSRYLIEIDFKRRQLILHNREYKIPSSFRQVDIEVYKNKPFLKIHFEQAKGPGKMMNLLLDTGASLSLLMYSDSSSTVYMPDKIIPGYLGSGLGGMLTGYVGKTHRIQFDTFQLPGVITHFLKLATPIGRNESQQKNGLVGNQVLDKFTMILDYQKEKLFLRPEKNYREVLEYDKSGMLVICGGANLQKYYVAYVIQGTPASEAGIQENDQILKINGWPIMFYSLSKINSLLQGKPGKKISVTVKRNNEKLKFKFVLRPLL